MILRLLCLPSLALLLQAQDTQAYEKVITKDAITKKGVFIVHQVADRYYYEMPKAELDKEFLWNTRVAKTPLGAGFGGMLLADRVVRWHSQGNRILDQTTFAHGNKDMARQELAANSRREWNDYGVGAVRIRAVGLNNQHGPNP